MTYLVYICFVFIPVVGDTEETLVLAEKQDQVTS